jgi:hypothetical protein
MDMQSKFPKFRIVIITFLLITFGLSCKFLSGGSTPTGPKDQNSPTTLPQVSTATPVTIPDGWKVSEDSTGACQVATPPDWQLGVDFFLGSDKVDPGPFNSYQGKLPPTGEELWKDNPGLQGHYFQDRRTIMAGDLVCSVWRIQADVEFNEAQVSELEEVGKTLREVKK